MAGTWKKSAPELVEQFDDLLPQTPSVERRLMFGYPCAFVGGNMFMGLYEDSFFLRLPPADRDRLLAKEAATPLEPMPGRPMKDYVVLPPATVSDQNVIGVWVNRAFAYAQSLPPKLKKATKQA